jgi:glycosyltransferase involved in cell wall biosynthesis
VFCIPNFIDGIEYLISEPNKINYIIMPANFGSFQNKIGLEWFLENVWDPELFNLTQFVVIGKCSEMVFNELNKNKNYKNVKAYGEVDDIKPYISKAKLTIVPLMHGSGTRLKCIESMALKTQIISTSVGAEGIEHEGSIIIADNPFEFKQAIMKVLKGNVDYTEKAFKIFENKYSLENNAKKLNEIILEITANKGQNI